MKLIEFDLTVIYLISELILKFYEEVKGEYVLKTKTLLSGGIKESAQTGIGCVSSKDSSWYKVHVREKNSVLLHHALKSMLCL